MGYTAEEVEFLLTEPRFDSGEAYRIYRAHPDGRLELKQVTKASWSSSAGIAFYFIGRRGLDSAWDKLLNLTERFPPPCEIELSKASFQEQYVLIMQYTGEYDDIVANWLLRVKFNGGDHVEAGKQTIENTLQTAKIVGTKSIIPTQSRKSRTREEVLKTIDKPIQR